MMGTLLSKDRLGALGVGAVATLGLMGSSAFAQAPTPVAPPPAPAPAAEATAPTLSSPAMTGPLALNSNPIHFDAAGLGEVYVTGVASGIGLFQSDPVFGDNHNNPDLSNAFLIVQKIDGLFQFYAQGGGYSLPALGTNYDITQNAGNALRNYFSAFPVGYAKLVPTDTFSISAGKLPTLIGAEYTFTFQNMNIERGLLWAQEPAISRGVQANLTTGPLAWAVSFNDGYYSERYNWMSGSVAWTINPANTLSFAAGGSLSNSSPNTLATPYAQNNGNIFNLIYTYNDGPWTITPYIQYTSAKANPVINGATKDANTWGGAILAKYSFTPEWSLAGRAEYISQNGSATDGTVNVLYGPGSNAFSFTLTPTYQQGIWFARAEGSVVSASSTTPGLVFGPTGTSKTQGRFVIEAGVLF